MKMKILFLGCLVLLSQRGLMANTVAASPAERFELENGLVLIVEEDHRVPVVAIQTWYRGGSAQEQEYEGSGVSHLIEHMLFKGTEGRGVGEIGQEVKAMGGSIGGYTTLDQTVYTIELPSKSTMTGLELAVDAMMASTFDPEEFEREREVVYKEINLTTDETSRFLFRKIFELAYTDHPYRFPVIGYKDRLGALTRDEVFALYKRLYVPNNLVLVVVGDVDTEAVHKKVSDLYAPFVRGRPVANVHVPERQRISPKEAVYEKDIAQAQMIVGFIGPSVRDQDLFAMDMAASILGRGVSSRLYQSLKEEQQLVHSISSFSYTPRENGLFGISLTTDTDMIDKAEEALHKEIHRMSTELVEDKELARVKAESLSSYVFEKESVEGRARNLGFSEVLVGNISFSRHYMDAIEKVTADDVRAVCQKYLDLAVATTVKVIPKSHEGHTTIEEPHAPVMTKKSILDNGMRVIVQEDRTLPIVSINAVFLGGLRAEEDADSGLSNFMANMLIRGTHDRTYRDIMEAIESRGGSISTYSGQNSVGIQLKLLGRDAKLGLEMLADVILAPTFPKAQMDKLRQTLIAGIEEQEKDVFSLGSMRLKQYLLAPHPYSFRSSGSVTAVQNTQQADLKAMYHKVIQPRNMVLTIYGDVHEQDMLALVTQLFQNVSQPENAVTIKPVSTQWPSSPVIQREALDKEQTLLLLGFPGLTIYDKERHACDVLNAILTGQGGRLFERVRGQSGLAYSVGSFFQLGLDPGYFVFYVLTVPDELRLAKEKIIEEIHSIQQGQISAEEIQNAKNKLIGDDLRSKQVGAQRAFQAALDELYGLGYDYGLSYETHISAVSKEDLVSLAKKYFDLGHSVEIVTGKLP